MDYISSFFNLKLASFEDIATTSKFDPNQKKVLYRSFINFLKNINNYPNALSRLLSLFQRYKTPASAAEIKSLDPGFFDFIKTNYKALNNEPFGGLYNFGNILNLYVTLLKKEIIPEKNMRDQTALDKVNKILQKNPSLNISIEDFKKFVESGVISKVKEIYTNHIKKLNVKYDAAFIKKCVDQYLKTESALSFIGKTPYQQKQEDIGALRQQSQEMRQQEKQQQIPVKQPEEPKKKWSPTKEKYKKYLQQPSEELEETSDEEEDGTPAMDGVIEHRSSVKEAAAELTQEDYTIFGTEVLPEFFKVWLNTYADKILEKAGLSKKTETGSSFKKEETTDATGNTIRVGDKVKLVPTFSGDDSETIYTISAITNSIDTIEQDPTKRLDFVSLRDANGRAYDQEPHYMVIRADEYSEASEEDLLLHQALYDVLIKEAQSSLMSTDIVQKTMDDLNPGDKAKAVDPNGNEIAVSVNPTGDINLTEQNSTETPLTASKETIPQLEAKGFRLVQEQV